MLEEKPTVMESERRAKKRTFVLVVKTVVEATS